MANNNQAPAKKGDSLSQLLVTLIPILLYALVYFALFLIFRNKFKRFYVPRTFLGSLRPEQRTPATKPGLVGWFKDFYSISDSYVLTHQNLDGFLLLRLLKLAVITCVVGCLITWPILFPVNATGGAGNNQLDIVNMSNITNNYYRYFAHVGCAYLFFGFVLFMITRESIYYINLRQAYLISAAYASRISARTVLFTSVPKSYLDEAKLRRVLGSGVVRVWFASDTEELDDLVKQRDKTALKLEGAETSMIVKANKKRLGDMEKTAKKAGKGNNVNDGSPLTHDVESGDAAKYLTSKDRPTHRLKFLVGKKVDTIDWCRSELRTLIPKTTELQSKHQAHETERASAVFVEFSDMAEAQAAYQSLAHHQALHMAPRYTGMVPGEIIWKNLGMKWWSRVIRGFVVIAIISFLVLFWSVITAGIGAISNVDKLTSIPAFSWLSFIEKMPAVIRGVVTGLLPVILLAVVMALLPMFLRYMAKTAGAVTLSQVELSVQNYYFAFQIVNVFLSTTLGSSASAAAGVIAQNPSGITSLLASSIPKASNFYLCYFILQGLAVVSSKLLRVVGLIVFFVLSKLLDKTPRKMYKRWYNLTNINPGTLWPIYTNLFVIALCYACIAPLVLGFAAIGLYLFYFAHRYDLLFVSNEQVDTQGRLYPRALQQLFVGLYVAEGCLIGLFAIGTGSGKGAIGPLILMIAFLIFTAVYQMALKSALAPLVNYLPKDLVAEHFHSHNERLEKGEKSEYGAETAPQGVAALGPAPHKKPNMLTKFLAPHIYNDFATMQRLVADRFAPAPIQEEDARLAYFNPSITGLIPYIWIPRDTMGISKQEIAETQKVTPITDEHAHLNEKNKIVYSDVNTEDLPVYQRPVDY